MAMSDRADGSDGFFGQWPGDETDEEIAEALAWLEHDPHEGMMTRREVLGVLCDYYMRAMRGEARDSVSALRWHAKIDTYLQVLRITRGRWKYRSDRVRNAAHELALLMDAEREGDA
jgi:hypothetical protein